MAEIFELAPEKFQAWLAVRPANVRAIAERLPPNRLYRLKTTGHRVTLYSVSENNTVTVEVTGEYNLIDFPRRVLGVNPDDLEECDLPKEGELLGIMRKTEEETIAAVQPRLHQLHREGKRHNMELCTLCQQPSAAP